MHYLLSTGTGEAVNNRAVSTCRWSSEKSLGEAFSGSGQMFQDVRRGALHSPHVDDLSRKYHRTIHFSWTFLSFCSCLTFPICYYIHTSFAYLLATFCTINEKKQKNKVCNPAPIKYEHMSGGHLLLETLKAIKMTVRL